MLMGKAILTSLFCLILSSAALAKQVLGNSEVGWKTIDGKPMKDEDARKSKNGFGGWIILADNLNWEKEWRKTDGKPPVFKSPGVIKKGSFVELLIFISNPKLNSEKMADVRCDISVILPSGKVDILQSNMKCFDAKIADKPFALRIANSATSLHFDNEDPSGEWKFEVRLRDNIGGTLLFLTEKFTLK